MLFSETFCQNSTVLLITLCSRCSYFCCKRLRILSSWLIML